MPNLFEQIFERSRDEKLLLSIFSDEDEDTKFTLGVVTEIDEDFIKLVSFDREGKYDGCHFQRRDSIYHIEYLTKYNLKIQQLITLNNQMTIPVSEPSKTDKGLLLRHLKMCIQQKEFVAIWFSNDYSITGYITRVDDEYVEIECYDRNAEFDGYSIHELGNVLCTAVDRPEDQSIKQVIEYRKISNT